MNTRKILLASVSALAILSTEVAAQALPPGNFVFGMSSATVSATTAQGVTNGAITSLSSQVNNQAPQTASGDSGAFTINADTTTAGGPANVANNLMSATAIANQFASVSGSTYTISPSGIPAAGNAVIGTSQLNYNSSATTNTARLGRLGVDAFGGTPFAQAGTASTVTFDVLDTNTYTVTSGYGPFTTGSVWIRSGAGSTTTLTNASDSSQTYNIASGSTYEKSGASDFTYTQWSTNTASLTDGEGTATLNYIPYSASTSGGTPAVPGTQNVATFTAAAAYGAPVAVDNNTFAARINGNLALGSIAGPLPVEHSIATGTASVQISGVSTTLAPVGSDTVSGSTTTAAIIVTAPISLSNVQQNLTENAATALRGSVVNTLVSAAFTGTGATGFNGGSVSTSGNAVSANAAGNSGTVGINLDGSGNPVFAGGVSLLSAQGNNASGSGASLTVAAENLNAVIRIQAQTSTGTLTQLSNSNALLNSNAITSRTALNDLAGGQTLTTAGVGSGQTALFAGGTAASSPTALVVRPITSSSAPSLTAQADYLNLAMQSNVRDASASTVTGTATTGNAIIGFFGGVQNGNVTAQGNTISATAQGNAAVVDTSLGWAAATAHTVTGAFQNNDGIGLTGTLSGTQVRISDSAALTTDLSTSTYSTVASAQTGSTFTNANLTIGSATSRALGNTASVLVLGNNGTVTSNVGQAALGSTTTLSAANLSVALSNPSSSPAGTVVTATAPTTTVLVQQNLNLGDLHAHAEHPAASTNNYLFQIDAYQGLTAGVATIGNNSLQATAAGNLGQVASTVSGAAGNTIGGGVGVLTVQGNQGGSIAATLGAGGSGATATGPVAVIGLGSLTNGTAQVVDNNFAALAVGNSATGELILPSGTIAGGTGATSTQFSFANGSNPTLTANYALGNVQVNAGTALMATNADTTNALAAFAGSATVDGVFLSRMNVNATNFSNATASVTGNTASATVLGNEYIGGATGFVAPAGSSGGTFTSLAVANTQLNLTGSGPTASTSTTGTALNIGNAFVVGLAGSPTAATAGSVLASSTGTITNSILQVANNTVSAGVTMNSARLSALGLATSGSAVAGESATVSGSTSTASAGSGVSSQGPVTVTNTQVNALGSDASATTLGGGAVAYSGLSAFSVNWNSAGSQPTSSTFRVDGNAVTATVLGNDASLSASLAAGPTFVGGIGLNNVQQNVSTAQSGATFSSVAVASTFTAGVDIALGSDAFFTPSLTGGGVRTIDSVVSVSNNRMTAATTLNQAQLTVTNPSGTLIQGGGSQASTSVVSASGASATATATVAVTNTQANSGVNAMAYAGEGVFLANASATDGVITVDGNRVEAAARGNTATTSLSLPRIDGSVEAFNAQTAAQSSIMAEGGATLIGAASVSSRTENSPVSVSSNLISAAATVNNYVATLSGLGQTSAASAATSNVGVSLSTGTLTATRTSGDVALVSAQSMDNVQASAVNGANQIGIALANVSSGNTGSPLTVNLNSVTATANGNVSAQSLLANGAGESSSRGGFGVVNAQQISGSTVSALVDTNNIAVTASNLIQNQTISGATSTVINSPVSVNGNTVGSAVNGNNATLGMSFASTLRAAGTGLNSSSSVASAAGATAVADYTLLNYQTTRGSTFSAATSTTNIGFTGVAATSPVNVQNNLVYANAFGNTASMSMVAPLAGGSMQSTSYQSNVGSTISASVTGASMAANLASGASTASPVNVTGNQIRAVAVGNSLTNQIGR